MKRVAFALSLAIFLLFSCQKENSILDSLDTQSVNTETASASFVSEASSISANVVGGMTSAQYAGARTETEPINGLADRDDRLKCATVTVNRTGTKDDPAGTITITFDPSCTDRHGVKRAGSIIIRYKGKRWMPGSFWSLTYKDFYRNSIHIEGLDSVVTELSTDSLHLQFHSLLVGGKVTFLDGKTVTREHNLTREWFRASLPGNDEWHTLKGGTADGTNKKGNHYSMIITKDLVEKASCRIDRVFIPVSGTKEVTVTTSLGTKTYVVDYGDGACDNEEIITVNGKQKSVHVDEDGD